MQHGHWVFGHPDRALERTEKAITPARELTELRRAHALFLQPGVIHQFRRDEALAKKMRGSRFHHFCRTRDGLIATTTVIRGWTLTEEGREEGGDSTCWAHRQLARSCQPDSF
jgi:hypothetical protein